MATLTQILLTNFSDISNQKKYLRKDLEKPHFSTLPLIFFKLSPINRKERQAATKVHKGFKVL